jgi:hypothetical protein
MGDLVPFPHPAAVSSRPHTLWALVLTLTSLKRNSVSLEREEETVAKHKIHIAKKATAREIRDSLAIDEKIAKRARTGVFVHKKKRRGLDSNSRGSDGR